MPAAFEPLESRTLLSAVSLQVIADTPSVQEGQAGSFTIHADRPVDHDTTVKIAMKGTARNGADYTRIPRQVVIPQGQDHVQVAVNTIDDILGEADEQVVLKLGHSRDYKVAIGKPTLAA